jgi:hypothetical protein
MNRNELIDGYTKGDVLRIIASIDKRINKTTHIKDITKVQFVEKTKDFTGWTKPEHYSVSYTWEGESSTIDCGYIKDGIGDCAVFDFKRQLREIKMNELLKEI